MDEYTKEDLEKLIVTPLNQALDGVEIDVPDVNPEYTDPLDRTAYLIESFKKDINNKISLDDILLPLFRELLWNPLDRMSNPCLFDNPPKGIVEERRQQATKLLERSLRNVTSIYCHNNLFSDHSLVEYLEHTIKADEKYDNHHLLFFDTLLAVINNYGHFDWDEIFAQLKSNFPKIQSETDIVHIDIYCRFIAITTVMRNTIIVEETKRNF